MKFKLGHRPALDGLRGICVLLVMWVHLGSPLWQGTGIGVDGFFVLSGFLITTILVREWHMTGGISLPAFYARRALRLLPALFLVIVACTFFTVIWFHGEAAEANWHGILLTLFYSSNWVTFVFGENNIGLGLFGHSWSLAIEEQFYLVWPLVLTGLLALRLGSRRLVSVVALLALASAGWRLVMLLGGASMARLFLGSDMRADALLTGCTIGLLFSFDLVTPTQRLLKVARPLVVCAVALIICLCTMFGFAPPFFYYGGFTLVALAFGTIIFYVIVAPDGLLTRILTWGPLVRVGVISYGLYLWHYPVFHLINTRGGDWTDWPAQVARVGITFGVSVASFRYLERPMLRLKERFSRSEELGETPKPPAEVALQPLGLVQE